MTERTELEKMLAGELYDASDRELAGMRERAGDLCRLLNASPEADGDGRRSLFISLFSSGGETVNVSLPSSAITAYISSSGGRCSSTSTASFSTCAG